LTLIGLLLTGFGLTLRRMARAGLPLCIGVMRCRDDAGAGRAVFERVVAVAVANLGVVKSPLNPNNHLPKALGVSAHLMP
jgi:hypothetical protein